MSTLERPREAIDPRGAYRDALVALAEADERVVCLDSDTGGLEKTFGARFPDRYFNVGIAEANMFGIAAGLAARGYIPYVHTMATFATMRAAEALKLDIAGHALPVRIVATHGGLSAAHFGTSHYALEDLAVVRAVTGVTIVVPADGGEIAPAVRALHGLPGPAYLRLGRSATPPVHDRAIDFALGSAVTLRPGDDVTVIATGPEPALLALDAARSLADRGIGCRVLEIHTLAPFDGDAVIAAAAQTGGVVTVEEHRAHGGLGDAVAEILGAHHPVAHVRVAVTGAVGTVVRTHREALEAAGVSALAIHDAARQVMQMGTRQTQAEVAAGTHTGTEAQSTPALVARLYARVLGVDEVGQADDFFVLGGTSLSAMELLDEIEEATGVRLPVGRFYRATGVAELAAAIDEQHADSPGGAVTC